MTWIGLHEADDQPTEPLYVWLVSPVDEERANVTLVDGPFADRSNADAFAEALQLILPRRASGYEVMTEHEARQAEGPDQF
jgi:hypothetical protein